MIKPVPGYEGLYSVRDDGTIYSHHSSKRSFILRTTIDRYGRERAHLHKNYKRVNKQVHRIVAQAFLDDYCENLTVNHKDGNPRNNHLDNLEMCTVLENLTHARSIGISDQKGEKHSQAKLNEIQVREIRELLKLDLVSQRAVARLCEVHFNTISEIGLGKSWSHIL